MDDSANECSVALDKPPVGYVAVQEFDVDFEVIRHELPVHDRVYFGGYLQGTDVSITIDTGASITLVSHEVYLGLPKDLRPPLQETKHKVSSADGTQLKVLGQAEFDLKFGPVEFSKMLWAADIHDEVLLGADTLLDHTLGPMDLLLSEEKMSIQDHLLPIKQVFGGLKTVVNKVYSSEDFVVPALSEAIISFTFDHVPPGAWTMIEPSPMFAQRYGLVASSCLIDLENPTSPRLIKILNPSEEENTIHRGAAIGQEGSYLGVEAVLPYQNTWVNDEVVRSAQATTITSDSPLPPHLHDLYEDTCEGLNEADRRRIQEMLVEFAEVFSKGEEDLGLTHLVSHSINTGNAVPVKQTPHRVPLAYAGEDKKALDKLLQQGCIRPSSSPWASPIVLVRKKDGSIRPCTDFRRVNALTVKDAFPLPRTTDCLDAVAGAKWFSTLDITSAYNQIPVAEDDIPMTAFVTKHGLFEHLTVTFWIVQCTRYLPASNGGSSEWPSVDLVFDLPR